uniref:Uncharacterized protein n=1 Tax=Octopus bimaculoides TaxID=37653 RepID=A0A0L8G2M1_OCTBM
MAKKISLILFGYHFPICLDDWQNIAINTQSHGAAPWASHHHYHLTSYICVCVCLS